MPRRHFSLEGGIEIEVQQEWKDDGKGGTELGFGACVYRSSFHLSLFISKNPSLFIDKRVVEIGCGVGLASIAVTKFAAQVVATDGDLQSLRLTEFNAKLNKVSLQVRRYLWGEEDDLVFNAEVMIASDIVACPYVRAFEGLLQTFLSFLEKPGKKIYLAFEARNKSEEGFFAKLVAGGAEIERMSEEAGPVSLFRLRRAEDKKHCGEKR